MYKREGIFIDRYTHRKLIDRKWQSYWEIFQKGKEERNREKRKNRKRKKDKEKIGGMKYKEAQNIQCILGLDSIMWVKWWFDEFVQIQSVLWAFLNKGIFPWPPLKFDCLLTLIQLHRIGDWSMM